MELLIIIGLFAIILILFSIKGSLEKEIQSLSYKLDRIKSELENLKSEKPVKKPDEIKPAAQVIHKESTPPPVPVKKEEPVIVTDPFKKEKETAPLLQNTALPAPKAVKSPVKPPKPSFFERNPDMEKFIGENLINKIGIAILVLGIGFFVKYAIDQNWITEIGRVFIGILCGGILIGLAHLTRKNFKAFSSVLVGGGMAVLYFTIAIAFKSYEMFSPTIAFLLMVVITAFSVLLSILYDRIEIAVLAIIGGFVSPLIVSTGQGNYIVLFTYILILNVGMLVLAYYKKWNLVTIISYVFTILLYGGWFVTKVQGQENSPLTGAFLFATIFYLVFFIMNIINNIKEKRKFIATEISILLSNTFLYYSVGILILNDIQNGQFNGLFTASIAIFNFLFAFILYKNKKVDLNLVYLLIGLVLTFLSLSAPVQLEGNYITLFWASEAVLLLWLSRKSGIKLIKLGSMLVNVLMFISLIMDWFTIYSFYVYTYLPDKTEPMTILLNKGFITSVVALTSIALSLVLVKKEEEILAYRIPKQAYSILLKAAFILFLYVAPLLELVYQLRFRLPYSEAFGLITGSYNLSFIAGLLLFVNWKGNELQKKATTALGVLGIIAFLFAYTPEVITVRDLYLYGNTPFYMYAYHYIDTILTAVILILSLKNVSRLFTFKSKVGKAFLWFMTFSVVFMASAELDHLVVALNYAPGGYIDVLVEENQRIGYPILWGLCSFVLMIIGMNKKIKVLRIISLTLFFITLLKLFIFDIRDISEGGKIAAFICLGILLLIISFMYQKLKKLVLEDEAKTVSQS